MDLQSFPVVPFALTDLARHVDVWQEVHLNFDDAFAPAGFAAPTFDVEGEATGHIAPDARLGYLREQFADAGERVGIGGGIGARRATNGRLVDVNHFIQILQALDAIVFAGLGVGAGKDMRQLAVQDVGDERALAGARDAGDHDKLAQRDLDVDSFQVVLARSLDDQRVAVAHAPLFRYLDGFAP